MFLSLILDQFAGPARPMSQAKVEAITTRFTKTLGERMLIGELTHHRGSLPGGERPPETTNQRNGTRGTTVLTADGPLNPSRHRHDKCAGARACAASQDHSDPWTLPARRRGERR